ncbi:MAG: response regulator [Sulfurimicrobium sp.]|nr:response regulator [Sulfurimicrobium sp.]
MYRIMLVDDEENILKALRRLLINTPCIYDGIDYKIRVESFSTADEALEYARHNAVDLVLSDYRMPHKDGVTFLKEFRGIQPNAARLILSGYADLNAVIGAINEAQIYRFINKPWNDYELVSSIAQALAYRNLMLENLHLADKARVDNGTMSAQELERKRLEEQEPGITKVNWGPDGSVIFDEM